MANKVYIATSLDGYIADKNGGLDWLPSPDTISDSGFEEFMDSIDALVMGRNTFDMVCSFGSEWFYTKKVFVVSDSLSSIPKSLEDKVELLKGTPKQLISILNKRGYKDLYIDGGKTIQSFLKEDLIDEITITTIPVLLGGGISLFGELENNMNFELKQSKVISDFMVQTKYIKKL